MSKLLKANMQAWKTSIQVFLASSRTRTRYSCCLIGLKELYFTPFTQRAAYSYTRTLFCPRDSVSKSGERFTSSKLKKTFVSKQHKYGATRDEISRSTKTQKGKVSPELQKLRFEEFSESESGRLLRHIQKESELNEDKQFEIVFGVAPCLLALTQSRRKQSRLFVKNGEGPQRDTILRACQEAVKRGVQIQRVSKQTLDKMCGGKVHQGLCLQASPLGFITEEKPIRSHEVKNHRALWLVLDGVQDPMNLGAILRSAYFLGVDRIASSIHNRWS